MNECSDKSSDTNATPPSALAAAREWFEGCLVLMGMLSWTVSRFVPVEFCWNSMAETCPTFG